MYYFRKILSALLIIAGLGCLFYPFLSTYYNGLENVKNLDNYEAVAVGKDYTEEWQACMQYNEDTRKDGLRYFNKERQVEYLQRLNVAEDAMCFIEIPKIDVCQPVYHFTEEETLKRGVGHMYGTSLPTGGKGTHSVLSGHTGMASQMVFTELTKLEIGDTFFITVLDETHGYRIDQIEIVEPTNTELLAIDENEDYCTLITCVPLGINTHRLLVRGKRDTSLDSKEAKENVENHKTTTTTVDKINWTFIIFAVLLVSYLIFAIRRARQPKKDELLLITREGIYFRNIN